jgi:hypothetical protein
LLTAHLVGAPTGLDAHGMFVQLRHTTPTNCSAISL